MLLSNDFSSEAIDILIDAIQSSADASSQVFRLLHGRGRTFSGLEQVSVDNLGGQILIALYKEPDPHWLTTLEYKLREQLMESNWLEERGVTSLVLQHRARSEAMFQVLWGELKTPWVVEERGLKFLLNLGQNQNHGLFLDMVNGREWVRANACDKRVLNLFAYTCGFSLAAMAGNAKQVVNLDMSKSALSQGRENHRINQFDLSCTQFLSHDLFNSWGKLRRLRPFDLVIIDPPSFQKGSFALKDYPKILRRLPDLLTSDGEVLACVNDPAVGSQFLIEQMGQWAKELHFVGRLANPESFPELENERALKVMHFSK